MDLVVDLANVMGSKPDGWWRDRAAAATRLLARLAPLSGRAVALPGDASDTVTIERVIAVVEGRARQADAPAGVEVVQAPGVGDDEIVAVAERLVADGGAEHPFDRLRTAPLVVVVTADRGLRARLPERVEVAGPGWLNELIGR